MSGFKVWPRDVEDVLYQHWAVREAAEPGCPTNTAARPSARMSPLRPGKVHLPSDL